MSDIGMVGIGLGDRSWPTNDIMCPCCGHILNRHEDPGSGRRPGPGDVTVCINCAGVLHFTNDMGLAVLPDLDLLGEEHRDQVERLRDRIRNLNSGRGLGK